MKKAFWTKILKLMCIAFCILFIASYGSVSVHAKSEQPEDTISINATYGLDGLVRTKSLYPVYITLYNKGANFQGILRVTCYNQDLTNSKNEYVVNGLFPSSYTAPKNKTVIRDYNVNLKSGASVTNMLVDAIHETNREYTIEVLDNLKNVVARDTLLVQNMKTQKAYTVAVLGDRYDYYSTLRNFEWPYEQASDMMGINPVLLQPSQLKVECLYANMPDVLIMADYGWNDLSIAQKEALNVWRKKGGVLIEDADLSNILDKLRDAIAMADVNKANDRVLSGALTMDDAFDALSEMLVVKRPNVLFLVIVILLYALITGPILFYFLKRKKKQLYLWRVIGILSLFFTLIIVVYNNRTRIIAPFLTYYEQIEQTDSDVLNTVDMGIQSPSNNTYTMHVDPAYKVIPWLSDNGLPASEVQNEELFGQVKVENLDGRKKITISDYPNFTELRFTLNKMSTVSEENKLVTDLKLTGDRVSGSITNNTNYDYRSAVIKIPNFYIWIGDIKSGETVTLKDENIENADRIFDDDFLEHKNAFDEEGTDPNLKKMWTTYLKRQDVYVMNDSVFLGIVTNKDTTWQKDSGYKAYGVTFYKTAASVDNETDGMLYIPYMQQYRSNETYPYVQGWANQSFYIDSPSYEATYHIDDMRENAQSVSIALDSLTFVPVMPDAENIVPFNGSIEIYNFEKGVFDDLDYKNKELVLSDVKPYVSDKQEFVIRYNMSSIAPEEELQYAIPELHAVGKVEHNA